MGLNKTTTSGQHRNSSTHLDAKSDVARPRINECLSFLLCFVKIYGTMIVKEPTNDKQQRTKSTTH
jgi:hypothetical protein